MTKQTKARKYKSSITTELLAEIAPLEMAQTKVKMQLAAKIEDLVKAKNWTNAQFAEKLGKNASEISKWFSGTQNFTIDTLTEIASVLGVEVGRFFHKQNIQVIDKEEFVLKSTVSNSFNNYNFPQNTFPNYRKNQYEKSTFLITN
jgi:transcriptional regulator with XRE-family HTH domain